MSPLAQNDAQRHADRPAAHAPVAANAADTTAETTTDMPADSLFPGPGVAQYFVVPWEIVRSTTGEPISLRCLYFDNRGVMVGAQPMACRQAFFLLTQGGPDTVPRLPQPPQPVDVALFSAVARTLTSSCLLNSSFNATPLPDGAPSVLVPVAPGTTRGVILVFRYPATGVVEGLVASADPEIKNTSGTSDPTA
nr:hypothetical protein [uncultured Roseateles sp.]